MAKKNIPKQQPQIHAAPVLGARQPIKFTLPNMAAIIVCILYFAIHFIPDWGGYDAMGIQWFYFVLVDAAVVLYILARKDEYRSAAAYVFNNNFSKLYIAFFALAGISVIMAINPTEGLVCYVRLIATIVAFFNVSILLEGRIALFRILSLILSLILLIECFQSFSQFFSGIETTSLGDIIFGIKGTAGNKNIYSAGLVVKIPFVLYGIHTYKLWGKVLHSIILVLASALIIITSTRTSYLGLILMMLLYFAYCIKDYRSNKKLEPTLARIGFVLIPILIGFFSATFELSNVKNLQQGDFAKAQLEFGSVTGRLSSITETGDESNQVRFRLWAHAIDYTKHHPIIGCGLGNWKIASIPYQRAITNDLYVPVHAHNDFLEMFAELGIPGGLVYLGMFVCLLVLTIKTLYSDAEEETKLVSAFSLIALAGYAVDSMFNFPTERPISQVFFMLITALNVTSFIKGRREINKEEKVTGQRSAVIKPVFGFISILLLIPSFYVTYFTYKSLIIQRTVLQDLNNEPLKLNWRTLVPSFPAIPNLTATAQPVESIKGRYLYEAAVYDTTLTPPEKAQKYQEALVLLDKGREANPVIGYSEFLKAGVYFHMDKLDSASRNALIAFNTRPKAKTYYQTLVAILAKKRDTVNIKKAFAEYDRYRHHVFGWDMYLRGMMNARGNRGDAQLLAMADSGIHMFAKDSLVVDLVQRKNEISQSMVVMANAAKFGSIDYALANKYYAQGIAAFGAGDPVKNDLNKAAELFVKAASINPTQYIIYENAAMCYFNGHNFKSALVYFDKALALGTSTDGKSEFFKAVSLMNLNRNDEGCAFMKKSKAKGYKEKEADMNAILKSRCGG